MNTQEMIPKGRGTGHSHRGRTSSMYIDTRMFHLARFRIRAALPLLALQALAALVTPVLTGCDLFGSNPSTPVIGKPTTLTPQADTFGQTNTRTFSWLEELVRTGKADTLISFASGSVRYVDSTIGGIARPFYDVQTSFTRTNPAPAGFFAHLGFIPGSANYDTSRVPDPGPALRFPVIPTAGWRLDTIVDGLRFVRVLTGTATLDVVGLRYETWAFAESTWWNDPSPVLVSTASTYMGRDGLVKSVTNRLNYSLNGAAPATLRRTLQAN